MRSEMRLCALLLAGLLSLGAADFNTFDFAHSFSKSVGACDDLYLHSCNFDGNRNESFGYELRDRFYDEILNLVLKYDLSFKDHIFSRLRYVFMKEVHDDKMMKEGIALARKAYEGEDYPIIREDYEHKKQLSIEATEGWFGDSLIESYCAMCLGRLLLEKTSVSVQGVLLSGNAILSTVECVFSACPAFIQGIALGYKKLTDHYNRMDMEKWTVKANYRNPYDLDVKEVEKDLTNLEGYKAFLLEVLKSRGLAPYVNIVVMKLMIENGKFLSKEKRATVTKFYGLIRAEFIKAIREKEQSIEAINGFKIDLYFSDDIDNLQLYEDALKFYEADIRSSFDPTIEQILSCDRNCTFEQLRKHIHMSFHNYLNRNESNGSILRYINGEYPIYTFNPTLGPQHMSFFPAVSNYLSQKLPYGIQFGAIGFSLARELIGKFEKDLRLSEAAKKHLQDQYQCYSDYYQSYGAKEREGVALYPEEAQKTKEGILDVEAMRIALNAMINSSSYRGFKSASLSMSTFNDVEWFFLTAMLGSCDEREDLEQYEAFKNSSRTRDSKRLNAIARQMPQFSRMFRSIGAAERNELSHFRLSGLGLLQVVLVARQMRETDRRGRQKTPFVHHSVATSSRILVNSLSVMSKSVDGEKPRSTYQQQHLGHPPLLPPHFIQEVTVEMQFHPGEKVGILVSKGLLVIKVEQQSAINKLFLCDFVTHVNGNPVDSKKLFYVMLHNIRKSGNAPFTVRVRRPIWNTLTNTLPVSYDRPRGYQYFTGLFVLYPASSLGISIKAYNNKVYVSHTEQNSLAMSACYIGDCIVEVGGVPVTGTARCSELLLAGLKKDKFVTFTIERAVDENALMAVRIALLAEKTQLIDPLMAQDCLDIAAAETERFKKYILNEITLNSIYRTDAKKSEKHVAMAEMSSESAIGADPYNPMLMQKVPIEQATVPATKPNP
uniref:PDZ domain-containing protein n=1 Tax=Steinernema glaseri TaxID=37863 RepID=A0A1I7ZCX2_9BILA